MTTDRRPPRVPGVRKLKAVIAGDSFAGQVDRLLAEAAELRGRVTELERRLAGIESDRTRWIELEASMPELLHTVSVTSGALRRLRRDMTDLETSTQRSTDAADTLAASINELWVHLRTVRAEVLHELRARTVHSEARAPLEPRIIDDARVASLAANGPLRLNLGCGHLPLEAYVNVDMRPLPGVDVVATLDDLPFEAGSIGEVHSAHVLEHFTTQQLENELLSHWLELLRPGGVFRASVPDATAMAEGLVGGTVSFEDYSAVLMGGQEYEGDFHFAVFSPESLCALLDGAGFVDVEVAARGRPLDICLEMEVRARRPG